MKRVSYGPLWKTLIDKKMTKLELRQAAQLSKGTITKMGKEEPVGLEIVLRIATALGTNNPFADEQKEADFGMSIDEAKRRVELMHQIQETKQEDEGKPEVTLDKQSAFPFPLPPAQARRSAVQVLRQECNTGSGAGQCRVHVCILSC